MTSAELGAKGWRNNSTYSKFVAGSERADKSKPLLLDSYGSSFSLLAVKMNTGIHLASK